MQAPIAVTIPEAVKASGMSRTSIYLALKHGHLTARKAGRRTLICFADLEAFLAGLPTYQAETFTTAGARQAAPIRAGRKPHV